MTNHRDVCDGEVTGNEEEGWHCDECGRHWHIAYLLPERRVFPVEHIDEAAGGKGR